MKQYIKDTLQYYDEYANEYQKEWTDEFLEKYDFVVPDRFLSYLKPNSYILDLGCGSGRDSKYFMQKGHRIKCVDGSKEMCKIASDFLGTEVQQLNFMDLEEKESFDGVFACASLLHLDDEDLSICLKKIYESLKPNGILYISFKFGEGQRMKGKRYFNDMTEEKFKAICDQVKGYMFLEAWVSEKYANHKQFINFILKKV